METTTELVEDVTKSEIMNLASWEKPRSTAELLGFIAKREAIIFATEE